MPANDATPYNEFMKDHIAKKDDNGAKKYTHTRIGNDKTGKAKIFGGSYYIPDGEWDKFMELYHDEIFLKGKLEHLTEKQLKTGGPLLVDLDFRYDISVTERQHSKEHILDLLEIYLEEIKKLLELDDTPFNIAVFEKPNMNRLTEASVVKDGIHIMFGLQMDNVMQVMLREKILAALPGLWGGEDGLPITNTFDQVLDDGITAGHTNWQLYGSRKPDNEAYVIKYSITASFDPNDGEFAISENSIGKMNCQNLKLLSARNNSFPKFDVHPSIKAEFESRSGKATVKRKPPTRKLITDTLPLDRITNKEILDMQLAKSHDELPLHEYMLKEIHDYTMVLPESYYGPGSHQKWIKVGMALRETSPKLFLTWIKFSSQSSAFLFSDIPSLYEKWESLIHDKPEPLTYRSIIYWAQVESPEEFEKIKKETLNFHITETMKNATDYDLAMVLYIMYKDRYICQSIKNNIWYEYKDHRWEDCDSGHTLRLSLSKDVYSLYARKVSQLTHELGALAPEDPKKEAINALVHSGITICTKLKNTNNKTNIMKEAKEIFYVSGFLNLLDMNPYIMCCENGVIDFEKKEFRKGLPEDYCSKSTLIKYIPCASINPTYINEVEEFFRQLFPEEELRNYMWDHLASTLIGTIENQTFNIYVGTGRNGKSKLVELMALVLGDYKGTVPITLITQKRSSIGGTSSEVVQLKGTRYAVMQEPSKGDRINEGIMKEITGGDKLQGRALYQQSIEFNPQFKLAVCTNTLFDIPSNDEGTWRRIRVVDFKSKFTETPVYDDTDEPYQFEVDKRLQDKFHNWKSALLTLLAERAFVTMGNVEDCDMVLSASNKYRDGQDNFSAFARDRIIKIEGDAEDDAPLKKTPLHRAFKEWYTNNAGKNVPKGKELDAFMEKKYGVYRNGYKNIRLKFDTDDMESEMGF